VKTALITGITGQDGSYLAKFLVEKGYHVIGITRSESASNAANLQILGIENNVMFVTVDLLDFRSVLNTLTKFQPDEIYNLAAQSSVGLSFEQPIGTMNFNIVSVMNLLEAIRLFNKKIKLYQASSSEMYGKVTDLPITIHTPMHPLSPYAISKASAYWTVVNYRESYGLFACNGVLFNHESYLRKTNFFVKKVISEAIKNRHNPDWVLHVGNIYVRRDFGYAPKYVEAMWKMLQKNEASDYLICSGKSYLLKDIAHYIFNKLDIPLSKIIESPELYRPTDIYDIYGDNEKAKKELDWDYELNFYEVIDILIEEEMKYAPL
jgi:GDPmannose 4,6-dehydratase